ncbi:M10 family metallopeptidase C-terminal domain-containing protein [Ramlibacter sp. GTP1]|uniref:M10 family metallopeptidase C-terminal domain-containing protein n=2 Tax=Ramlibacter albus TaxID=2079448 RepID=A0A923S4V4_9BURK|nr:M10 family metallopeptidase C-terminal domain-containing protein [Ramlibacter albus]
MHELGHAFGLSHPYDPPVTLPSAQQTQAYSVLGYGLINNAWVTVQNGVTSTSFVELSGPMLYDIAAIQYLYGPNMSWHAGNDTYSYDPATPFFECIWDAGGNDTISVARFTGGCTIDLREGAFSSVAIRSPNPQLNSSSYDGVNVLSIAYGAVIENAIGGAGADTLTGNPSNNRLQGGGGNDTIAGGAGTDTAVFSGARANYTITGSAAAGLTVRDNAGSDGTDTIREVERLAFSDRGVAFDTDGAAGRAVLLLNAVMGSASLQNRALVGTVISLMDGGASIQVLSDVLVRNGTMAQLAGGASSSALVTYLFRNVVGSEASATTVAALSALIDAGALTQGQFLWKVAELPVNAAKVGITGLAQSGIEFSV